MDFSHALARLTGKRVVVTGATNGIGMATARALAAAGSDVVLAVRNVELGHQRAREFGGSCTVAHLDLADLNSVREFADSLSGPIDVLVNNAGMFPLRRARTVDGFESGMGTNFLGPFALTNLLLPQIREQIVIVGSEAHRHGRLDPENLEPASGRWSGPAAYSRSKLAVMLWGLELDRLLRAAGSTVTAMLTDPGWAASNISNQPGLSPIHRVAQRAAEVFGTSLDEAAAPILMCLTEPLAPGSYVGVDGFRGLRGEPTLIGRSRIACDYDIAQRLWRHAESLTGTSLPH